MFPCKTIDGQLVQGGDWPRILHHATLQMYGGKKRLEPQARQWGPMSEKEGEGMLDGARRVVDVVVHLLPRPAALAGGAVGGRDRDRAGGQEERELLLESAG